MQKVRIVVFVFNRERLANLLCFFFIFVIAFHTDPPARAAYAVKDLPLNALVEIEAIALA